MERRRAIEIAGAKDEQVATDSFGDHAV